MAVLRVDTLMFQGRGPYSFVIEAGGCCGLTGPSGAGKSLLLRALADLDPHSGTVLLGGVDSNAVSAPAWRKKVGLLPAESLWWYDRVEDHFSADSGLHAEWFTDLGFEQDILNWQVHHLSTGEKQRLAILRLLENGPEALLLDEPTASLDSKNIERAEQLLVRYCRERLSPVLWISHDKEQLGRVAGSLMIMDETGTIQFQGG